jgi:hypothetical protein
MWDSSLVWHIFTSNQCLPWNECPKFSWTHSQEEVEKIFVVFQWKNTSYQIFPLGSKVNEGFFWHTLDQNTSCACPIQGATRKLMSKFRWGEYLYCWHKAIDILKNDDHLLFGGSKSWHGNNNEKIEYVYKRLISSMDTCQRCHFYLPPCKCVHWKILCKKIENDLKWFGKKGSKYTTKGRFRQENVCFIIFIGYILVYFGGSFSLISCNILINI